MANGRLKRKVKKKLGISNAQPVQLKQNKPAKMKVQQPSTKGCCGRSR